MSESHLSPKEWREICTTLRTSLIASKNELLQVFQSMVRQSQQRQSRDRTPTERKQFERAKSVIAAKDMLEALDALESAVDEIAAKGCVPIPTILGAVDRYLWASRSFRQLEHRGLKAWQKRELHSLSFIFLPIANLADEAGLDSGPFRMLNEGFRGAEVESSALGLIRRLSRSTTFQKVPNDDEYQPASWFGPGVPARLRMAASPTRKTKRVRKKTIDGVPCYNVNDARRWWSKDIPSTPPKGT